MKNPIYILEIVALSLICAPALAQSNAASPAAGDLPGIEIVDAKWAPFDQPLDPALASGDAALYEAALRHIIMNGRGMTFTREQVHAVVGIYRNHDNDNMRRMAVVALGEMKSPWAYDFLARSTRFEKTPQVLYTLHAVLAERGAFAPQPADTFEFARK